MIFIELLDILLIAVFLKLVIKFKLLVIMKIYALYIFLIEKLKKNWLLNLFAMIIVDVIIWNCYIFMNYLVILVLN